jgi:predicted dehydrogenase
MAKLTSVLIGCGGIAREHIKALTALENVAIAAVCDLSAVRAESIASQFGIDRWFSDYERMLAAVRPDMVHITTPPASHFQIAQTCLEQRLNVLCEKPITIDYAQFVQLKALATANNCLLLENQNYRFHSSIKHIADLRDSGRLGSVIDVQISVALDLDPYLDANAPHFSAALHGGIIGDLLPHIAYLVQMFTGSTIDVRTIWTKHDATSPFAADEFRGLIRGERATAHVSFSGNARPGGFWVKVTGTQMHAEANLFETPRFAMRSVRPGERAVMTLLDGIVESRDVFRTTVAGFWRKLAGATSYDGLPDFISRIYRSLETGRALPITLQEIDASAKLVSDFTNKDYYL